MRWPVVLVLAGCGRISFAVPGEMDGDAATDAPDDRANEKPGEWRTAAPLPGPREFSCALGFEGRVYTIGGLAGPGGSLAEVLSARVDATGLVASWEVLAPLPQPTWWHACALDEASRSIYVTGGFEGPTEARDVVLRATIASDGSIGAWTSERALPDVKRGHGAYVAGGQLCVVGGERSEGFTVQSSVFCAAIGAGGALAPWAAASPLPVASYMFGTAVAADRVFVTGGYAAASQVLVGGPGEALVATTPLPAPRERHATAIAGGHVYVVGGETTFEAADLVTGERARITGAAVDAWEPLADLPVALAYASAAVVDGRIYFVGGSHEDVSVATVYVMTPTL